MKKILQLSFLFLAFLAISNTAFSQKKLKEGVVKFQLNMDKMGGDSPEMAMMGNTTLDFYFKGKKQKMDMNMMGGMMRIQTIIPLENPQEGTILMDMMGQKIQITEMNEDELAESNNFMNMDNVKEVTYNEKDQKNIAGFPCYFAKVTTKDDMVMKYYITEKIQPPMPVKKKDANILKGYPLEMIIDTGQGVEMVFTAQEVSREFSDEVFKTGEGYTPMTMSEFQEKMGALGGGGFGFGN
ncbi:MAG: hypothetical protein AAFZ15_20775 [Bacteroidota bacterium]